MLFEAAVMEKNGPSWVHTLEKAMNVYIVMFENDLIDAFTSFDKAITAIREWTETDGEISQVETYGGTKLQQWDFLSYVIHEVSLT